MTAGTEHRVSPCPTAEATVRSPSAPAQLVALLAAALAACTSASPVATLDEPRQSVDPPVAVAPAPDGGATTTPVPRDRSRGPSVCDDDQRATLVATVDGQLDAIAQDDWERALDFASSGFRSGVDPARFRAIITEGFPVVAGNRARDVGACRAVGDDATLLVTVEDGDGTQQVLLYLLEREADGWGIGGAAPASGAAPVPDQPTVTA